MLKEPDWVFISGSGKTKDRQDEYAEVSELNNKSCSNIWCCGSRYNIP